MTTKNKKFSRSRLEKLTRARIKQVNEEAGYRKYLEVPEMVEIVASSIEEGGDVETVYVVESHEGVRWYTNSLLKTVKAARKLKEQLTKSYGLRGKYRIVKRTTIRKVVE